MKIKGLETTSKLKKPNSFLCDCDAAAFQLHRNSMVNTIKIEYCRMLLLHAIAGSYGNKVFRMVSTYLSKRAPCSFFASLSLWIHIHHEILLISVIKILSNT